MSFGKIQVPADFEEELEAAERKRLMAQLLLQKGMTNNPQGRMISGHYVRTNPLQHLAGLTSIFGGQMMDAQGASERAGVKRRYEEASAEDLAKVQALMRGSPEQQVPNFVMAPERDGSIPTATQPGRVPDMLGAEQAGQASQFPASQALGKALFEGRMKNLEKFREELMKRVGVQDMPAASQADPSQPGQFQPRQKIQMVDGIPVAVPEEFVPGGAGPSRIGPGYQPTQVLGADGRPMAAQQNPVTEKVDVLDKAPRVTTKVNTGKDPDDEYYKTIAGEQGKAHAAILQTADNAVEGLKGVEALRKLHVANGGEWTGGPIANQVQFLRDLAAQAGVPLDQNVDLNNAQMQAEFTQKIAAAILGQGRGLTNEDRQALERSFPTNRLTPAQLPAFLQQYETILRRQIARGQELWDNTPAMQRLARPGSLRTPRQPPPASNFSTMSVEELERRRQELLQGGKK